MSGYISLALMMWIQRGEKLGIEYVMEWICKSSSKVPTKFRPKPNTQYTPVWLQTPRKAEIPLHKINL